jgi:hypothetical protein
MRRDGGFSGERDGEEWSPRADVSAFAMLLFEIVGGHPWPPPSAAKAAWEVSLPPDVPAFVSVIIEGGLRLRPGRKLSFIPLFESLRLLPSASRPCPSAQANFHAPVAKLSIFWSFFSEKVANFENISIRFRDFVLAETHNPGRGCSSELYFFFGTLWVQKSTSRGISQKVDRVKRSFSSPLLNLPVPFWTSSVRSIF